MERAVYGADAKARILLLVEAERAAIQRHYATPGARFAVLPPILPQAPQPRPWSAEQRQAKRAALGFTAETLALLFVASRFRTKGLDRALAAVDRLPRALRERALLLVVGGDRARPYRYRRGVDRAVFLGARDDLGELMRAADLLLHPAREEMAGKVLVEAMQQGLPVLCSGVAGYAPLVARAAAGVVLPEPFRQPALDRALATLLAGLPDAALKENGPAFVRETPEFGRGIAVAVATVDRWARQGGGR